MWGFELVVMFAMIGVNSVFAGYELALASVTLARLQRLADENRGGAKVALYMKQNMEASLAVVQLGITLVGAVAAAVGGAGAGEKLAPALLGYLGMSKAMAGKNAIHACIEAIEICGAEGTIARDHQLLEKWFRDIKVYDIFEGTGAIQRIVISKRLISDLKSF